VSDGDRRVSEELRRQLLGCLLELAASDERLVGEWSETAQKGCAVAEPTQAGDPPADLRTISFGPINVTADYQKVVGQPGQDQNRYLARSYEALGGQRTDVPITGLDADARTWLAYALCLYQSNKDHLPTGADHKRAAERLIAWAPNRQAMPGDSRDKFEREALTASGWTEAAVPEKLILPPEYRAKLAPIYSAEPAPVQQIADIISAEARMQAPAELQSVPPVKALVQPGVLLVQPSMLLAEEPAADSGLAAHNEAGSAAPEGVFTTPLYFAIRGNLLPKLTGLIADQASYWREPDGRPLAPQSLELLGRVANLLQVCLATVFRPYADGWPAGQGDRGFRYSEVLKSTGDIATSPEKQLGHLFSRALRVGWDTGYEAPLATAGYDSSRPEDEKTLRTLLREALDADSQLRSDVIRLIQFTSTHTPSDPNVYTATVFPSSKWEKGPAQWRWQTIRTLIHELLHKLAHPKYIAAARQIRNAQVIVEGFVELLTVDCFSSLAGSLSKEGSSEMLAALFEGVTGDPGKPDESLFEVGYGQAGQDASKVRELVENENVRAAFFLGAIDLIGIKPATQ
jgi:hypothetical protein